MRIVFVRHGEPDYARDCLTETGREQAAAAAERLHMDYIITRNVTDFKNSRIMAITPTELLTRI